MTNTAMTSILEYGCGEFVLFPRFNVEPISNRIRYIVETSGTNKQNGGNGDTILDRIASGDPNAVQDCINRYSGLVWSLARKMIRNNEEAEDAVQDIFIEIWKSAERFDASQASETTFIAMIARRRLIDRIRKIKRTPSIDSLDDMITEPANDANKFMQLNLEARQAAEVFTELKPEQRNILRLSIVEGYSHSEIAEALELPLGTVKTHARRGLIEVRKSIDSKGFAGEVTA